MGGGDEPDNLVDLTPEEHYVAHQLLVKIHPNVSALVYAANMMTVAAGNQLRSNKRYGWLKRRHIRECRKRIGAKNASYGRRWYHDPETGESGKYLEADVPSGWTTGRVLNKERFINRAHRNSHRKAMMIEKQKARKKLAEELYQIFKDSNCKSLLDFVNQGYYDKTHEALRLMWKEHIPEYANNSLQGVPFRRM
jgi:hypothetical protein